MLALLTWIDWVLLLILLIYIWQECDRGVFGLVAEMIAWILGWIWFLQFREPVQTGIITHVGVSMSVAYVASMVVLPLMVMAFSYAGLLELTKKISKQNFSRLGQLLLGLVPAVVNGLLGIGLIAGFLKNLIWVYPFKWDIAHSLISQLISRWW